MIGHEIIGIKFSLDESTKLRISTNKKKIIIS